MSCGEHVERDEELGTDLGDVVQSLIAEAGNSARLLECYYWNQEPGLLEMIRAFLAMPIEAQTVLRAFLRRRSSRGRSPHHSTPLVRLLCACRKQLRSWPSCSVKILVRAIVLRDLG